MSKSQITRQALADALVAELESKPIERVSVRDVTQRCGLSRQAFYYHFHDMYELAKWVCEREADEVLGDGYGYDTWQQALLAIMELMRARRDIVTRMLHTTDPTYLMTFLRQQVGRLLMRVVDEECAGLRVSAQDRELVARFYASGLIGVVYAWVSDGMREEPSSLVGRIALVTQGTIPAALGRISRRDGHAASDG